MVAIRAIPKSLLPHEVRLIREKPTEGDFWEDKVNQSIRILKHVRMEPSSQIVRDKNNAEVQLAATLFYDCKNSIPRGVGFLPDDVVEFNGQRHKVQVVKPLYDQKKLHHYEVGLIKHA